MLNVGPVSKRDTERLIGVPQNQIQIRVPLVMTTNTNCELQVSRTSFVTGVTLADDGTASGASIGSRFGRDHDYSSLRHIKK